MSICKNKILYRFINIKKSIIDFYDKIRSGEVLTLSEVKKSYIYAYLAVLAWSTVATVFKLTLINTDPVELVFISTFFSLLIFLFILIYSGEYGKIRKLKRRDFISSILMGFLNPFLYYIILFEGYRILPAQMAQPLNMTWGIIIAVLSVPLLKHKFRLKNFFALLISFFGVVILSTNGELLSLKVNNPKGVALVLLSSVIWSVYWLLNTRDKKTVEITLFLNFLFGFIFILIYLIIFHRLEIPLISGVYGGLYIGAFEMGITYFIWSKAMKTAKNIADISILIYLVPFISLIFIHEFLKEKILISSVVGLLFIISGIIINKKIEDRKRAGC